MQARLLHGVGQLGRPAHGLDHSRGVAFNPLRHLRAGADGKADFGGVAVDEPPQRCCDVRVVPADAGVNLRLTRREIHVPGSAQELLRLAHDDHATRGVGVHAGEKLSDVPGDLVAEVAGFSAKLRLPSRIRRPKCAQEPHAGIHHHPPRYHAGEQGDLGVVVHYRMARLDDQLKRAAVADYAHRRQAQVDRLSAQRGLLPQPAYLLQQRDGGVDDARLHIGMHALVVQPRN